MRDPENEIETLYKGAIVYAIDPEDIEIISTRGMADIYGLTAAEDEVCNLLVKGYDSREIADQRKVSIERVRTQMKHLMDKTAVHNRASLIRLALSVNLPISWFVYFLGRAGIL